MERTYGYNRDRYLVRVIILSCSDLYIQQYSLSNLNAPRFNTDNQRSTEAHHSSVLLMHSPPLRTPSTPHSRFISPPQRPPRKPVLATSHIRHLLRQHVPQSLHRRVKNLHRDPHKPHIRQLRIFIHRARICRSPSAITAWFKKGATHTLVSCSVSRLRRAAARTRVPAYSLLQRAARGPVQCGRARAPTL